MVFKVGEKYRLKVFPTEEDYEEIDTGAGFVEEMLEFSGKVLTVTHVTKGNPVLLLPSGEEFYFSPNWLEPVNRFKGNK